MDKNIIKQIIEAGNLAPSGGNSQPWKFKVNNNLIEVISLPEKDHPILNFKNRGTHIAHGALIENIETASLFFGYKPYFELFPEEKISVKITLESFKKQDNHNLYEAISKRHSNRKPYNTNLLSDEEKNSLFQDRDKFPECRLFFVEEEKIRQVSENLARDVTVFLQNQLLHKYLFQEIIWKEEEQKLRGGLFIKTMEMTPPKSIIFKLLSNWTIAKFFNKIKFPKKIYEENIKTASSAGLIGIIAVENNDKNFLYAGRLMENIWLRTAKLNLSFQLITGIPFLWQQLNFGNDKIFSKKEKDIINGAYNNLLRIFNIENKIIALAFRIGKSEKPLAISYKRPPEINWE